MVSEASVHGPKAQMAWWETMTEESCPIHDSQEAQRQNKKSQGGKKGPGQEYTVAVHTPVALS